MPIATLDFASLYMVEAYLEMTQELKGTLMQIWKVGNIFVYLRK